MNSVKIDAIAALVILVVGVICSIIFDGVFREYNASDKTEVLYALCTFVLPIVVLTAGWLALKSTFHDLKFDEIKALADDLKLHANTLNTKLDLVNELLDKQNRLADIKNNVIIDSTSHFIKAYIGAFKVQTSTFSFESKQWSLYYNSKFWKSMINAQRGSTKPIWVFATHTLDPLIWNTDTDAKKSLVEQSDFIKQGGKIIRLFVHKKSKFEVSKPQIPPDYLLVMSDMEKGSHIETYYVEEGMDFNVDATWVPELHVYMTWGAPKPGDFTISNDKDEADEFRKAWLMLEGRAIGTDHEPIPSKSGMRSNLSSAEASQHLLVGNTMERN